MKLGRRAFLGSSCALGFGAPLAVVALLSFLSFFFFFLNGRNDFWSNWVCMQLDRWPVRA